MKSLLQILCLGFIIAHFNELLAISVMLWAVLNRIITKFKNN